MTTITNTPFISVTKGGSTPELVEGFIHEHNGNSGNKYDRNLDIKTIAKLVRTELAIEYPTTKGWKFSVKIERYAGGQSMNIFILSVPSDVFVYDALTYEAHFNTMNGEGGAWDAMRHTNQWKEIFASIEAIQNQYNYDNSDSQTDYFDVNFYGHVSLDSEIISYYKDAFGLLYGEFKF